MWVASLCVGLLLLQPDSALLTICADGECSKPLLISFAICDARSPKASEGMCMQVSCAI